MESKRICDVSVVCANYNNGKYLTEFIDSVVNSTAEPKELIIVDDGSTDNSLEILHSYQLKFLKIIPLPKNVGFANALNVGVSAALGKYILRIDPDDIFEKHRIEVQYDFLEREHNVDLTGSNVIYFNEKIENKVGTSNFPTTEAAIIKRYKKGEHGLLHGSVMGKASLFKAINYIQANVPAEDYDLFARMIRNGAKPKSLGEALTFIRIHESSVSNDLPFSTIKNTYRLRDEIFKTKTRQYIILVNYISLKSYRRYYFEKNPFIKLWFLAISVLFRPDKALKKIL